MWVLFRFSLVVFALLYRWFSPRWKEFGFRTDRFGKLYVRVRESKNKKTTVAEHRISTECKFFFRLKGESRWTRFCKRIGLGVEFQVGAPGFDEAFYVASDHPAFLFGLKDDPDLQARLLELKSLGFTEVLSTGTGELQFTLERTPSQKVTSTVTEEELGQKFDGVRTRIENLRIHPHLFDRWILPILLFETAMWGLGAYGAGSYLHIQFDGGQSLLNPWGVWSFGLSVALVILALWLFIVGILLRKSSRVPLLVVDLFFYLFVGIVFGGYQSIADLNLLLDRSEAVATQARITKRYSRTSGSGKNRRTSHYLELQFGRNPENLPDHLRVSSWNYYKLTEGQGVEFQVRQGGLGFAYIEDMIPVPPPVELVSSPTPKPLPAPGVIRELISWSLPALPLFGEGVQTWAEVKYGSGKYRQREPLVNGLREGRARYWYENGQLYAEIPWVGDQKHGCFVLHRPDATVEQVLSYRNGKPHGLLSWHDASGVVIRRALYQDGVELGVPQAELKAQESQSPCRPPGSEPVDRSAPR
jgi:hypothetical protein